MLYGHDLVHSAVVHLRHRVAGRLRDALIALTLLQPDSKVRVTQGQYRTLRSWLFIRTLSQVGLSEA